MDFIIQILIKGSKNHHGGNKESFCGKFSLNKKMQVQYENYSTLLNT